MTSPIANAISRCAVGTRFDNNIVEDLNYITSFTRVELGYTGRQKEIVLHKYWITGLSTHDDVCLESPQQSIVSLVGIRHTTYPLELTIQRATRNYGLQYERQTQV
jgi:hypothetical protein